ncbi:hypothetical protein L6164_007378 [Bauhinia variegata]|uniref:Uncharacterized protein n=1 Tax=Bauhinia variegata TaxID=167791 RepID=A0ACB9PEJ0_BAUVA|nr:hypothetical protein L6164_007378 [Bauhinia variegata]
MFVTRSLQTIKQALAAQVHINEPMATKPFRTPGAGPMQPNPTSSKPGIEEKLYPRGEDIILTGHNPHNTLECRA